MANRDMTLTGDDLQQFLDQLEADLEEGGSSEAVDLRARLNAQPLRADTLEAIGRLHTLWMQAGDAAAARAVIEKDGAALLAGLSGNEKNDAAVRLALLRLQVAEHLDDAEAMLATLAELRALADAPDSDAGGIAAYDIFTRLCHGPHLEVALEAATLCHALEQTMPAGRSTRNAVEFHRLLADIHARHGDRAKAAAAARQAVATLKATTDAQNVDADDWLSLGDAVIDIAPECLPDFQAAVTAFIKDWPLPRRRETEVRLARLKARATYAQDDLAGALAACEDACYSLDAWGAGIDDFIEYELPWLLAAGRIEEAGERAFMAIYDVQCLENGLPESVYRIVLERLADPAEVSVWWPLCVMRACIFPPTVRELLAFVPDKAAPVYRALFGDFLDTDPDAITEETDLSAIFQAAREVAEKRAEKHALGHIWMRRLAAVQDFEAGRIDAPGYLREINAVIASGLNDCRTMLVLHEARLAALGIMEMLKSPLPVFSCGVWAYRGAGITDDIQELLGDIDEDTQNAVAQWVADFERTVYEQGRACMERYFETGKGHRLDASAHLYSMLCNNLAILYRADGRQAEALELHRRGIEASSFAEHYDGIFCCYADLEDDENIIKSAEDLWHYAAEYGYGRFDPEECARFSASALYRLQRARDIPIWLERLTQWERQNDFDENDLPEDHLYARIIILFRMTAIDDYREMVWDAWQRIEAQVRKSETGELDSFAGDLLRMLEHWEDALFFYERDDTINGLSEKGEEFKARCLAGIAKQKKAEKRWWQVWK